MPFVSLAHRTAPTLPFQQPFSLHRTVSRFQNRQRPRVTPKILHILQPPAFLKQSDFIYEDGKEQQTEIIQTQSAVLDSEQEKKLTQPIIARIPKFAPQQNYPTQPLSRTSGRANRRAEPKYPPHYFCIR
ncbi:unnamed protein product [Adineta steineri]|uniref:Uncharacterized protein n=1 Tax=Adineta steineri TaxID=433720 RepID=A0A814HQ85_9BILA|nr:unnamed protein product [Adineta steineri]CAF3671206.1 unnamed protein product [Adineta steineri]